jgi:hypothetical protein
MVPKKIRDALESSTELKEQLEQAGIGQEWKKFNRTVFDFLARRINRKVTQQAIAQPSLVLEKMIIGKDQLAHAIPEKALASEEAIAEYLANQKRPINWISGKTLHSYWINGKPKETKLHVLLVYLQVKVMDWDAWKNPSSIIPIQKPERKNFRKAGNQDLIINYFLGSYYLYYQKSDSTKNLVKAPFIIKADDRGQVIAETLTEGHPYRSSLVELRDGILYVHCENQLFDEKENHIFNVGNETNPEVLFGVSNTISVKKKLAIGIRNVLVKQKIPFSPSNFIETEIPFSTSLKKLDQEEEIVLKYFLKQEINHINTQHCCPLSVLEESVN